ncbi:MAG: flavin reductase family protein [Rhizobiales bacterium]|nr:flavin reductase family protein [Hyphomicrobiales bacterium]
MRTQNITANGDAVRDYRDALGKFGTGVTLITTQTDQGPIGITVNSFASVSLDPALVLWSVAKKSGRYAAFRDATHFAIHILAENQMELAMTFAKNANMFEAPDWDLSQDNIPLAKMALARFECANEVSHDAGDHSILVGRVLRFSQRQGQPLLFSAGKFGTFTGNQEA